MLQNSCYDIKNLEISVNFLQIFVFMQNPNMYINTINNENTQKYPKSALSLHIRKHHEHNKAHVPQIIRLSIQKHR